MDTPTVDMLGMALGLGEEIAIDEKAGKMSQTDGDVSTSTEITVVPLSPFSGKDLVDLTQVHNWLVPMTKRFRSPFIEKWKRVSLGYKDPNTPLLSYEEEEAYHMAHDNVGDDDEINSITAGLNGLKILRSKLRLKNMGKKIDELRCTHGKSKDNGKKRI